jgi:hypothetical protein
MATTDARAGFRLPWSSDRSSSEPAESDQTETPDGELATEFTDEARAAVDWPASDASANGTSGEATAAPVVEPEMAAEAAAPPPPAPSNRKPSKFLADLTKAMQAAAEEQRAAAVSQLQADAKSHVEAIHGRSSAEAATLRRTADDDVAAIREWSKAEIARIREETETKITDRKAQLERQIEEHAAVIEREIEAVTATVTSFETEMASFFERLLAEEDPARFATMAENLPEAPTFEGIVAVATAAAEVDAADAQAVAEPVDAAEAEAEPEVEVGMTEADAVESVAFGESLETVEASADDTIGIETDAGSEMMDLGDDTGDGEYDREAAFAAIQAAAEAAASAEVAADAAARAEAVAEVAIEIVGHQGDEEAAEADPRMTALGLSPDYDAAEAEALAAADGSDEEIPVIEDEALASRLAGLVPGKGAADDGSTATTTVVVTGLVSVASIASFKRHLGRLTGVNGVGVSSGPDGEFVFAVSHGSEVVLRDVIPGLPSFQARVTGSGEGTLNVTAHDPESDS